MSIPDGAVLLTATEVAGLYHVALGTSRRWGKTGVLLTARTPSGQPRFFACEVRALLRGEDREHARKLAEAERDRLPGGARGGQAGT